MSDAAEPRRVRREPVPQEFPHRVTDSIRLGDLDPQNHVNNAVFATYFETGRVYLLRHLFGTLRPEGVNFVLARVEIDYRRELHWPGPVEIGTRVERLGTSSLTLEHAVFKDGYCAASGRAVLVLLDAASRRPRPFSPAIVARLETLIV